MLHLSPKYAEAVAYAATAHADQVRKGTDIPYVSHVLAVSALVVEHGGSEAQAIAGLLHDVLEDCGPEHGADIEARFGAEVLAMVEALTDGTPDAQGVKPPWQARKQRYLDHLAAAELAVVLVSACDKLHNATAIADDHAAIGEAVFDRFSQPKAQTVWYYHQLAGVISRRLGPTHPLVARLQATLGRWAV